jgi:hypothetical protein
MAVALEPLVVHLIGDGRAYSKMLGDAQRQTQQAAKQIEAGSTASSALATTFESLTGVSLSLAGALAVVVTVATKAWHEFTEAEAIASRLEATLEANARNVEMTKARYEAYAQLLERTTTLEGDFVLALLTTAEGFGLTNAKAEEAVRNAAALAAIKGGTGAEYIRITAAMAQGDFELARSMGRLIPELRAVKSEYELVQRYQSLVTAGLQAQARELTSAGGAWKRFTRDVDNAAESLGRAVAKPVTPAAYEVLVGQPLMALGRFFEGVGQMVDEFLGSSQDVTTQMPQTGAALQAAAGSVGRYSTMTFEAQKATEDFIKALEHENRVLALGADQAKLFELQLQKLPPAQAAIIQQLIAEKKEREAVKKAQEEAAKAAEQAVKAAQEAAEDAARAARGALQKTADDVQRATEQIRAQDPAEAFVQRLQELQRLRGLGLPEDVFTLGIKQAREELVKASQQARQTKQSFDAALAGSAEALSRIAAYRQQGAAPVGVSAKTRQAVEAAAARAGLGPLGAAEAGKNLGVLPDIRDLIKKSLERPPVVLQPAAFH